MGQSVPLSSSQPSRSHAKLQAIPDQFPDCFVAVGGDLRIAELNSAAALWLGRPPSALVGCDFFEAFKRTSSEDRRRLSAVLSHDRPAHFEIACALRPGRWMDVDVYPSKDGTAAFVFRDITDSRNAETKHEEAQQHIALTLDAIPAETVILDHEGRILMANGAWSRLIRQSAAAAPRDGAGEMFLSLAQALPTSAGLSRLRAGFRELLIGTISEFECECEIDVKGLKGHYRLHATRFAVDGYHRVIVTLDNVTELHVARHDVDSLISRMIGIKERERAVYAAELHDSTVQHLTAVSLNLMAVKERLTKTDPDVAAAFDNIERSLDEAQREIRSVSYLLYPRELDRDGLASTLKRFVGGYSTRTRITSQIRISDGVDLLPVPVQKCALRIAQEALTNVHRHSSATAVTIKASVRDGSLSLSIRDNGTGFSAAGGECCGLETGVGIPGMKARAHQFGGTLKLRSDGGGTQIVLRIPGVLPRVTATAVRVRKLQRPALQQSAATNRVRTQSM